MVEKLKTLKIKPETHAKLVAIGKKEESFDDIINRLLKKK
jgi:predicted CopG family antitoxin